MKDGLKPNWKMAAQTRIDDGTAVERVQLVCVQKRILFHFGLPQIALPPLANWHFQGPLD